jgi:hypothetical protein
MVGFSITEICIKRSCPLGENFELPWITLAICEPSLAK